MLARLLYAAVGLCVLGTLPQHAAPGPAPRVEAAGPARPAPRAPRARGGAAIAPRPPDFAIPRTEG